MDFHNYGVPAFPMNPTNFSGLATVWDQNPRRFPQPPSGYGRFFLQCAMPLSFKIQIMHDETFKMRCITSLNSNWFQNGQPSKLEEWKNVRFTSKTDVFFDCLAGN